jgi:iron transport multicopper oxidase
MLLYFLFTILSCCSSSFAKTVTLDWNITFVENANPDGKFARRVIGINGKWPIDPIIAEIGDRVVLKVFNELDVLSGLHAHGLFHNNSIFNDGAIGITDCGIAPGTSFTYEYQLTQSGTYWIHGHRDGQYVDGLQAAFVIQDPTDPATFGYDNEFILPLSDWYHEQHSVLYEQFLSIYNPNGAEPIPNSALIDHGKMLPVAIEPGSTVRIRLISMTAIGLFNFYIEDHKFQIIEVDGVLVEPYETDVLYMSAAQRYSILVKGKPQTSYNYRIHAKFDQDMLDSPSENPNATLGLVYANEAPFWLDDAALSDYPSDFQLFDQMQLVPIVSQPVKSPDSVVVFDVEFLQFRDAMNHGTFNRTIFQPPLVPSIFTAMSMGNLAMDAKSYGTRTVPSVLNHLDNVQLVVNNLDAGHHPCIFYLI